MQEIFVRGLKRGPHPPRRSWTKAKLINVLLSHDRYLAEQEAQARAPQVRISFSAVDLKADAFRSLQQTTLPGTGERVETDFRAQVFILRNPPAAFVQGLQDLGILFESVPGRPAC